MENSIPWLLWLRFSVLFLSCRANARVKLAKSGHGPHLFRIIVFCVALVIVLCYCLYAVLLLLCCTVIVLLCYCLCCPLYWLCVLYHCHRVLTQLQLTNISISNAQDRFVMDWNIQDRFVTGWNIQDRFVTGWNIRDRFVTGWNVQDRFVTGWNVQDPFVTVWKIQDRFFLLATSVTWEGTSVASVLGGEVQWALFWQLH